MEAARTGLIPRDEDHPHLVLLGVPAGSDLQTIADRLRLAGIPYRPFHEPDRVALADGRLSVPGELTAICTAPLAGSERARARRLLRSARLLELGEAVRCAAG